MAISFQANDEVWKDRRTECSSIGMIDVTGLSRGDAFDENIN